MRSITVLSLCLISWYFANSQHSSSESLIAKLGIPFGTILQLEVKLVDGDSLQRKEYQGMFLMSVLSINDSSVKEPVLLTFSDESGKLANNIFRLFQLRHGKRVNSVTSEQTRILKKSYVNNKYVVIAYETGEFNGLPTGYEQYQPVKAGKSFGFEHRVVVLSVVKHKGK